MKKTYVLLMNEDVWHWTKFLSMHMVQFDSQDRLIYVVDLPYSTWCNVEMIETNKEFNLYIFLSFSHKPTNRNNTTLVHDSFSRIANEKHSWLICHLSKAKTLIRTLKLSSSVFVCLMTLFSLIPLYYLLLIPSTIIIALTLYGLSWIGFQLFIHN